MLGFSLAALLGCAPVERTIPTEAEVVGPAPVVRRHEFSRPIMGVATRIVIYHKDPAHARGAAEAAFARMQALDDVLSDFKPDSEVNQLCERAGEGPTAVGDALFDVVSRSVRFAHASDGAFDVTVGPLVRLWREARMTGERPPDGALREARRRVGWQNIHMDEAKQTIALKDRGMSLDFGAIGKGYAADAALDLLREDGCPVALIDLGGDLALGDPPPGRDGWRVRVEFTGQANAGRGVLVLSNCGVATSGDADQFIIIDGERYSHIIDPRTGRPLRDSRGVSVIAQDATTADALASAISVLREEDGLKLAATFEGVRLFFQNDDSR